MSKKKKYYTVWEGNEEGVFSTWKECEQSVKGYNGAKYKSFPTKEMAEEAFLNDWKNYVGTEIKEKKNIPTELPKDANIIKESIVVDAACSGNPGKMEYRGVDLMTGLELFRVGVFENGTNNIGEFLAIVHALALVQNYEKAIPIYSDSKIAISWVKAKKCRTKVQRTEKNNYLFEVIQRAEKWLKENQYSNEILKWDTKNLGEIPADFGRK